MKKEFLSEIKRMKDLAGIISEGKELLKEDILELKQMSKQLYSFIKSKGFDVELTTKLTKPLRDDNPKGGTITTDKSKVQSNKYADQHVQIVVNEGNKIVSIGITPASVAKILMGKGNDWTHKAGAKFGYDWAKWQQNSEIMNFVDKIGNEFAQQIKSKYPNMIFRFEQQPFLYVLHFGYGETRKGGQLDPNKVKNPNPNTQNKQQQQQTPAIAAENRRMIELAGIKLLKEDIEIKDSVKTQDVAKEVEKSLPKVESKLEDVVKNLSPEQKSKIQQELEKLGIDDTTKAEEILGKIEGKVSNVVNESEEAIDEKSVKDKVGDVLHHIGAANMATWGGIPAAIIIGGLSGGNMPLGFAVSWGATALLMGLAKVLGNKEQEDK